MPTPSARSNAAFTPARANDITVAQQMPIEPGAIYVLSDRIGSLSRRQAKNRRNPMRDAVREVRVAIDRGKVLRILSNDLDAPPRNSPTSAMPT